MDRGMLLNWLLWTLAVCVCTVLADVNCSHQGPHGPHAQQRQCFIDQGIAFAMPVYTTDDTSEDRRNNYVETVIAQKPDEMCNQQREFKLALECAMTHTINCMPTEYQGYLPQASSMAKVVDKLCDNTTNIDFDCVKDKAGDLFQCGYEKGKEAFAGDVEVTVENILCKAFQFNADCQGTELRPCGCATVKAYESISRELLYPPSCPRPIFHNPPVRCDPKQSRLFDENKTEKLSASSMFHLFAVIASYIYVSRSHMHIL